MRIRLSHIGLILFSTLMAFLILRMVNISNSYETATSSKTETPTPAPLGTFKDGIVSECLTGGIIKNYTLKNKICHYISEGRILADVIDTDTGRKQAFENIFKKGFWGGGKIASGSGSSLPASLQARNMLHKIIDWLKVSLDKPTITLLDLPCGDLTWMPTFLKQRNDVTYTGVDIVTDLIRRHQNTFKAMFPRWSFKQMDISKQPLNESYDLILTRDALQHMTYQEAMSVMQGVSSSKSKYWLATTFYGHKNKEVDLKRNDRFRPLNIELPPFALTPPMCMTTSINEFTYLGLWKLPLKYMDSCEIITREVDRKNTKYYSCV